MLPRDEPDSRDLVGEPDVAPAGLAALAAEDLGFGSLTQAIACRAPRWISPAGGHKTPLRVRGAPYSAAPGIAARFLRAMTVCGWSGP